MADFKAMKNPINPATRKDSPQNRIYKIIKSKLEKDFMSHKRKIKFVIEYPLIKDDITPQFRIMSELEVNTQKNGGIEEEDIKHKEKEKEKKQEILKEKEI